MKSTDRRRMIIGLTGTAMALVVMALSLIFLQHAKWLLIGSLGFGLSVFIGSLFFISGGIKFFLIGFMFGTAIISVNILMRVLPVPYDSVFSFIFIVSILIITPVRTYLLDQLGNKKNGKPSKRQEKIRQREAQQNEQEQVFAEIMSDLGIGTSSLLVVTSGGSVYQMVRDQDRFVLRSLGNQVTGIDLDRAVQKGNELNRADLTKKDRRIDYLDLVEIRYRPGQTESDSSEIPGRLRLTVRKRHLHYTILAPSDRNEIIAFFGQQNLVELLDRAAEQSRSDKAVDNRAHKPLQNRHIKLIRLILLIVSVICSAAFLFLGFDYKVLSVVCMVIPVVSAVLLVRLKNRFTVNGSNAEEWKDLSIPLLFPTVTLMLRSLLDFSLLSIRPLVMASLAIFLLMAASMFMLIKDRKIRKKVLPLLIFTALLYVPSSLIQINCVFDHGIPETYHSFVHEKHVTSSSRGPDQYYLAVTLPGGLIKRLRVTQSFYESTNQNDIVLVVLAEGLLDFPYTYISEG